MAGGLILLEAQIACGWYPELCRNGHFSGRSYFSTELWHPIARIPM
jgi:hypothetical protein